MKSDRSERSEQQPKKEPILGVIRHVLTFAGGLLVANGTVDESTATQGVGALVTLAGVIWSILGKRSVRISKSFAWLLAGALTLSAGVGCASLDQPDNAARVAGVAKVAAYVGTSEALAQHPEWRAGFELAARDLRILEAAESLDAATLLAVVRTLPVQELRGDRAVILITSVTILIEEVGNPAVPIEQVQRLQPIARAIREGIELALR